MIAPPIASSSNPAPVPGCTVVNTAEYAIEASAAKKPDITYAIIWYAFTLIPERIAASLFDPIANVYLPTFV